MESVSWPWTSCYKQLFWRTTKDSLGSKQEDRATNDTTRTKLSLDQAEWLERMNYARSLGFGCLQEMPVLKKDQSPCTTKAKAVIYQKQDYFIKQLVQMIVFMSMVGVVLVTVDRRIANFFMTLDNQNMAQTGNFLATLMQWGKSLLTASIQKLEVDGGKGTRRFLCLHRRTLNRAEAVIICGGLIFSGSLTQYPS